MAIEFKLDPRDQEKYGGPEWVSLDREQLDDLPFATLHRWEQQLGISIAQLLADEYRRATARGIAGVVWIARQMAGVDTPFADFAIRPRKVLQRAAGDADPPADGSTEPSSQTA